MIIITAAAFIAVYMAKSQEAKNLKLADELAAEQRKISQLKKEQELYNLREKILFSESSEAFFVFDQNDGTLLEVNREAENLTGYSQSE